MSTPRKPSLRWSFRTRLAMIIAATFIAAGVCLLTVQYLLVSQLFDEAVATSAIRAEQGIDCTQSTPSPGTVTDTAPGGESTIMTSCVLQDPTGRATPLVSTADVQLAAGATAVGGAAAPTDAAGVAGTVGIWFEAQSSSLVNDVLTQLLVFSGVVLVVFAIAAAGIAWWLARRSLKRIGEVTAMAKDVSTTDLGRRLDLPGPQDEIKELADTIDAMLDRLESAFAAQDRFVANASHELRTPLTTSRTALEIPLAQGKIPADLQPAVRTALRAGEHSDRLIDSLLILSRGQGIALPETVDLAEVVKDISDQFTDRIAAAGLSIEDTYEPARTLADLTMLTQAVTNLLDNAVRHNVTGGRIWIRVGSDGDDALLTVENTGPVIDPDTVALLCEPFYRSDASRTSVVRLGGGTGVGLGLSIVSSINHAHQGQLHIAAREGGGLRVQWRLGDYRAGPHPPFRMRPSPALPAPDIAGTQPPVQLPARPRTTRPRLRRAPAPATHNPDTP